jgi:poly-gamma-glutamate synthesis protein (capsule biosynthesis protein)
VVFTNLEAAIRGRHGGEPTLSGVHFHGTEPVILDCLRDLHVNLLALANNHVWDYGAGGIRSTRYEAVARGLVCAGAGSTIEEATAPGYLHTPAGKVALVAMAHGFSHAATSDSAGVNGLDPDDPQDIVRNLTAITRAAGESEHVLAYYHCHQLDESVQRRWAQSCIDAGATIYVGHGHPVLRGIEIYRGKVIFHNLGNFIFHNRHEPGHYEAEAWESAIAGCTYEGRRLATVRVHPIKLNELGTPGEDYMATRGVPELVTGEAALSILERLRTMSRELGTDFRILNDWAEIPVAD